ncbi:hypothetical protein EDB83DRAFT_2206685, partial [Lactarius deliciosus]
LLWKAWQPENLVDYPIIIRLLWQAWDEGTPTGIEGVGRKPPLRLVDEWGWQKHWQTSTG